jgi:glucosamine--fructose-6-phosphate aminotransferase (isomerizing)
MTEGRYLRDILDQPQALRATLEGLRDDAGLVQQIGAVRRRKHARVVLTGMGSSLHALYPLELMLTAHGETVVRAETSELIHSMPTLLREDSIVVAVSQSGQSAETIRLLEQNQGRSTLIGVTNTKGSPLYEQADFAMLMQCGDEFSVSTKTYVASLLTLEVLGTVWCGAAVDRAYSELAEAPVYLEHYLADWRAHVRSLAEELADARQLFILGRGRSLAACRTGALTTKESTRSFAEGMSSAAFRHGPIEVVNPETAIFVFDGEGGVSELNRKLVRNIRERNGHAQLIGPGAELDALRLPENVSRVLPMLEIAPIQMVTLALAARGSFEPGRFAHAMKITAEE